jgi:hypothetical protein
VWKDIASRSSCTRTTLESNHLIYNTLYGYALVDGIFQIDKIIALTLSYTNVMRGSQIIELQLELLKSPSDPGENSLKDDELSEAKPRQ